MKYLSKDELVALSKRLPRGPAFKDWLYQFHRASIDALGEKVGEQIDKQGNEIARLRNELAKATTAETVWNAERYAELLARSTVTQDADGWTLRVNLGDAQTLQQAIDKAIVARIAK
jgi:hypothetical protein